VEGGRGVKKGRRGRLRGQLASEIEALLSGPLMDEGGGSRSSLKTGKERQNLDRDNEGGLKHLAEEISKSISRAVGLRVNWSTSY